MAVKDFDTIADHYARTSLVQKAAAETLFDLLQVQPDDSVLDLGCGPGHLTLRLAAQTRGDVVGMDPSAGMIERARAQRGAERVRFEVGAAEDLEAENANDVIFCNSAMQWFRDPDRAIAACARALRGGGRMAVQAPARRVYCPNFVAAMERVAREAATAPTFRHFHCPWFFLETAGEYAERFVRAGMSVPLARIEETRSRHAPEDALGVFDSGAASGYLGQEHYEVEVPAEYGAHVRRLVLEELRSQAGDDGLVELTFHRIFLLALKTR